MNWAKEIFEQNKYARLMAYYLGYISLCTVLYIFPIPFVSWNSFLSREIVYRLMAVEYPKYPIPPIVVVLATDKDLSGVLSYPLPHSEHARVVERMLELKPRAFFIDLTFVDERPSDAEGTPKLSEALKRLKESGTTIYVVSGDDIVEKGSFIPAFQELVEQKYITPVSAKLIRKQGNFAYPIFDKDRPNALFSFAARAYIDLCNNNAVSACKINLDHRSMEIWWGAPPLNVACNHPDAHAICDRVGENLISRLKVLAYSLISEQVTADNIENRGDPITIPYHPFMSLKDVTDGKFINVTRETFKGAIVIYGADFFKSGDTVYSPVYGGYEGKEPVRGIPGVFAHAMALDNFITMKGAVIENDDDAVIWYRIEKILFVLSLVVIAHFVFWHAILFKFDVLSLYNTLITAIIAIMICFILIKYNVNFSPNYTIAVISAPLLLKKILHLGRNVVRVSGLVLGNFIRLSKPGSS